MQLAEQSHRANRLLAALPAESYRDLLPFLSYVDLIKGASIYSPGEPASHVYFPHTGIISIVALDIDGRAVEVATVGREGMTGLPYVLGGETMNNEAMVQVAGKGSRIETAAFRHALISIPQLNPLLTRYLLAVFLQIGQNAACNQLHTVRARCARWLLTAHDRVEGDQFELTQQYLSMMLGVTRPSVSGTASVLKKKGLITYVRGIVRIVDRQGLEQAACNCYRVIENEFDRLRLPA